MSPSSPECIADGNQSASASWALLFSCHFHHLQPPLHFFHPKFNPSSLGPAFAFPRHWKFNYFASFKDKGQSMVSLTLCILLGWSWAEALLVSDHIREIYKAEWKLLFCQVLLTAGFQHSTSPLALCNTAGLKQLQTAQHALSTEGMKPHLRSILMQRSVTAAVHTGLSSE